MFDDDEPTRVEGLAIDRFWKEERPSQHGTIWSAGYHTENDCCYFNPVDFIAQGILGFCSCGEPEAALRYIQIAMQEIKEHVDSGFKQSASLGQFAHSEGEKYLVWYVLAKADLTEHGGAVPGWLTLLGEDILHDLDILNLAQ